MDVNQKNTEVVEETMTPEEFEQAQQEGMVFKSEVEAKRAAKKIEKRMLKEQKVRDAECEELVALFMEHEREDKLNRMPIPEREAFEIQEARLNTKENKYWRRAALEVMQNGAAKRYIKQEAEAQKAKKAEAALKKAQDQLTLKQAE